jgi:energy-coupling factor transporter ATP-binding protein EcfA2
MLHTLAVSNYRSLRQFIAPLGELTLITGPNGSGKSNVYRALRLLAETARGGLIASLAREGGFASARTYLSSRKTAAISQPSCKPFWKLAMRRLSRLRFRMLSREQSLGSADRTAAPPHGPE